MSDDKSLPVIKPSPIQTSVASNTSTAFELLSMLPEEQRNALIEEHTRGMLDINRKATEMHVDVAALNAALGTVSNTTVQAAKDGNSVTASHTQTTSIGRTEVIMGNTDAARVGKLTKSQTGEFNWTPIYIIIGIIALVMIASSLAK
ncbi:MAG: hypothetical protein KBF53_12090 [Sphingobium sp.]|nr:hypothetical protein [Sphingobium sp.]